MVARVNSFEEIVMDILTLKIPEHAKNQLDAYAQDKGISKSQVVREALVQYFADDKQHGATSFSDLARDLAGSVDAPPDLSLNKSHFAGYGQ